ncbi:LOW QUALITY PROTEIN: polyunsaturated fatty acid (12S)/(13S)-lipoxygenase, epidermal-type-like [Panthera tigris]|uniref:LOW QUALITY PROTEIN: polyunsaturated fatty acid (12S)/(13S)-lipoxygenase, epidermal-type-like n=1 Tax=Panthera tigris TaxID=9694 RepID=UPI001C6F6733|nr:LOW QUALITY PROTEIN: polyunsaturated fatty acid (12S)/(13S)-lipoxygenase, epidermal-type-like [Panthera tigris]
MSTHLAVVYARKTRGRSPSGPTLRKLPPDTRKHSWVAVHLRFRFRSTCFRREFEVSVPVHLGRLLLAKLRKILLDDAWFCERIRISGSPRGPGTQGEARFPCCRRVRGDQVVCLPEGTARTLSDDHQDFLKAQREQELQERKKVYRWGSRKDGSILPVAGRTQCDLPRNERFLEDKDFDFRVSPAKAPAPGGGWAPAPRDAKQGPFLVSRHRHSFRRLEGLASRVPWTSHSQLK